MKRFSFCLSFISIGLLFLTNYHPVEATNCTCNSNAIACIEDPAGQCPSGQRCNCSEHQITIDPNSGSIGCDTTQPICVSTPTSVPTPTPGGVQHGTCSGGYSDITGGCSATNDNCDQGYMPQFTNSDCTGSCWCVLSVYEGTPYPTINLHEGCPTPLPSKSWEYISTALGCVPIGTPDNFIGWLLQRLIGIGGGVAFLLVLSGGFKILTSAGNPKGIQAGQEMITSALIGLLFIIFSIFLLEFIGVKILSLPGLK